MSYIQYKCFCDLVVDNERDEDDYSHGLSVGTREGKEKGMAKRYWEREQTNKQRQTSSATKKQNSNINNATRPPSSVAITKMRNIEEAKQNQKQTNQ